MSARFSSVGGRPAVLLSVLWAFAWCSEAAADDAARIKKVLSDWESRRNSVKVVRYVIDGEFTLVKGGTTDPDASDPAERYLPKSDVVLKTHRELLFDYERHRHYARHRDESYVFGLGPSPVKEEENSFGGKESMHRDLSEASSEPGKRGVSITRGDQRFGIIDTYGFAVHVAHANVPWSKVHPGRLRVAPEPDLYKMAGDVVFEGRACWVVREAKRPGRSITATDYWVDPERGSIILRVLEMKGEKTESDLIIQYSPVGSLFLPSAWTSSEYAHDSKRLRSVSRQRVVERKLDEPVTDADFDLSPKRGELVTIRTNQGKMWDTRTPPPETYERVTDDGKRVEVEYRDGVERRKRAGWLWPTLAGITLATFGLWIGWRMKRAK